MDLSPPEPKLAPPGAGIPIHHKLFLRWFVIRFVANRTHSEVSKKRFERSTQKILSELENIPLEKLSKKVLVPPQMGLEDSSRFWSIQMTLEHLCIVGRQVCLGIEGLQVGQIPTAEADTAAVKPLGTQEFSQTLRDYKKFAEEDFYKMKLEGLNSSLRYKHPWFGPMNAKQWYWLLPIHQNIHLQQIRKIKEGLS